MEALTRLKYDPDHKNELKSSGLERKILTTLATKNHLERLVVIEIERVVVY